jgi:hypothetical protein
MFLLFGGWIVLGKVTFALSLIAMITSLLLSLWEIRISVHALDLHLKDIGNDHPVPATSVNVSRVK